MNWNSQGSLDSDIVVFKSDILYSAITEFSVAFLASYNNDSYSHGISSAKPSYFERMTELELNCFLEDTNILILLVFMHII